MSFFPQEIKGGQERKTLCVAGGDPELVGIVIVIGENLHSFIGEGVKQVEAADKQVGDADEEQIVISNETTGIPGDREEGEGHYDTEQFRQTVKEQVIDPAGQIYGDQGEERGSLTPGGIKPCQEGRRPGRCWGKIVGFHFHAGG